MGGCRRVRQRAWVNGTKLNKMNTNIKKWQVSIDGKYLCQSPEGRIYWSHDAIKDIVNMTKEDATNFTDEAYPSDMEAHQPHLVVGTDERYWFLDNQGMCLNYTFRPIALGYAEANVIKDFLTVIGVKCKLVDAEYFENE